jgi:hypothetical protein
VTEQGAVLVAESSRTGSSSALALWTAVAGFTVAVVVAVLLVSPRFVPDRYLATFALSEEAQLIAMLAGLAGAVLALGGVVNGLIALASAGWRGDRRTAWALALAVAGLSLVGFTWWFVNQSPYLRYGLKEPAAAARARLDALDAEAAVRTYLTARDLSVDYWLSDEQTRQRWHDANWDPAVWPSFPPWGVVAGVDDLQMTALMDRHHPATDLQRSFTIDCTARGRGTQEHYIVMASRSAGGPWRVEEIQFL